jgi:hypothetical protein
MKRWLLRMGLAVGIGWTLTASGASAQQTNPPPTGVEPVSLQGPGPVIHNMCAEQATKVAMPPLPTAATSKMVATPPTYDGYVPVIPSPEDRPGWRPICAWMKRHGFLCYAPHEWPTCGSIHGECIFMFGSCREFFGEPCVSGPQPPPWANGGNGGCNCRP